MCVTHLCIFLAKEKRVSHSWRIGESERLSMSGSQASQKRIGKLSLLIGRKLKIRME